MMTLPIERCRRRLVRAEALVELPLVAVILSSNECLGHCSAPRPTC